MNSSNGQYSAIQKTLNSSAARRKIESNTIVDSNCKIIANAYSDRRGEYFSPEGLCEDTINNPRRICILTTLSASEFAANLAPQYL
jgi:twitching motility protein PilJ